MNLFDMMQEKNIETLAPLADRMRPRKLEELIGQDHILNDNKFLRRCIQSKKLPSIILYGPPGTGKTTLAQVLANEIGGNFFTLNAVNSGVKEIRELVNKTKEATSIQRVPCIVFIDEIHRFSKNQQDALLPHVENGLLTLIGATTENPFFEINKALISRTTLLKLELLDKNNIKEIILKALENKKQGLGNILAELTEEALEHIALISGGDARRALNALEIACLSTLPNEEGKIIIDLNIAQESIQRKAVQYDKDGDNHYDTISAFIKSIRGSDPNAALHYLAKMLHAGEDPEFIARRLIISASEDIGNADPQALSVAIDAHKAMQIIGLPEGRICLGQATTYLACAPKSNASYLGIDMALADVQNISTSIPDHLKDAHYNGASKLGHGIGYLYPHNYNNNYVKQQYMPEELQDKKYYSPTDNGHEKTINKYLENIKK